MSNNNLRVILAAIAVSFLFIGMSGVSAYRDSGTMTTPKSSFNGSVLYVGGDGPNNYTKIQDAVDNATDGDTVFVYDDSSPYYESVLLNTSLTLVGENKETTIINANQEGDVITIQVDGCSVSGFTLRNCSRSYDDFEHNVVTILSDNNTISDNIVSIWYRYPTYGNIASIYLRDASYNTIMNNSIYEPEFYGGLNGIQLHYSSSHNTISYNNITNYHHGIDIDNNIEPPDSHNIITHNYIGFNHIGVYMGGGDIELSNNIITWNKYLGIEISGGSHVITGNIITYNGIGGYTDGGIEIFFESSDNTISQNHIAYNLPLGIRIADTYGNVITNNNFIDNGIGDNYTEEHFANAYFWYAGFLNSLFGNTWKQNYWSDHSQGLFHFIKGKAVLFLFFRTWYDIDWSAAKEPYDIL